MRSCSIKCVQTIDPIIPGLGNPAISTALLIVKSRWYGIGTICVKLSKSSFTCFFDVEFMVAKGYNYLLSPYQKVKKIRSRELSIKQYEATNTF